MHARKAWSDLEEAGALDIMRTRSSSVQRAPRVCTSEVRVYARDACVCV